MKEIKVKEVMSKNPMILDAGTDVSSAVKKMVQKGISTIIVSKNGVPVGIVTDRDLVTKIIARDINPSEITLEEIMSKPLVVVDENEKLEIAAKMMNKKKIRKLPVVSGGNIIGLLSENDIVKISPDLIFLVSEKSEEESKYEEITEYFAGLCDVCGQFSTQLTFYKNLYVCPKCKVKM